MPPVTYYFDIEQRSEQWAALRLGRLTGSCAADMCATNKDGKTPSASRRNLLTRLVLERLTERSQENGYTSRYMQDGIDREEAAIQWYEYVTGNLVHPIGFVAHNDLRAGCSPDGFVSDDRIVSVKCPIPATHLSYLETGTIPNEYYLQLLHESWLTGRRKFDFYSYNPDFPLVLQAKITPGEFTDDEVNIYESRVRRFLEEVDLKVNSLLTMMGLEALEKSMKKAVGVPA